MAGLVPAIVRPRGRFVSVVEVHAWAVRRPAAQPEFRAFDGFVRRRLRAILRKQQKRPGFGRCADDHQRWPNAFFANLGLFTLEAAWDQARRSR